MNPRRDLMLRAALDYWEAGFSIIPCGTNKKPLIKWEKYQREHPTQEDVVKWWGTDHPGANIGLITGKISGVCTVDNDNPGITHPVLVELLKYEPPIQVTPSGGCHMIFAMPDEEVRNSTGFLDKVDFRGEGGYIIVAPSMNGSSTPYKWERDLFTTDLVKLPSNIIKLIKGAVSGPAPPEMPNPEITGTSACHDPVTGMTKPDTTLQNLTKFFSSGRRDEDLFHAANIMVKGGGKPDFISDALMRLAATCNPPFSRAEAVEKVRSALNRDERKTSTMAEEVRRWVKFQDGYFTSTECCVALNATTAAEKNNIHVILKRLSDKDRIIERYGARSGCYRVIEGDSDVIDWENAPTNPMSIKWPLGIEDLIDTYPSNIAIFAGTANSGKTSMGLEFARLNAKNFQVNYFNSEMGASELRLRLEAFKNADMDLWRRVKFVERDSNFADVIQPNEINVIDYLEVLTDFWKIGEMISSIHKRLTTGIALILIQKNAGSDLGRGGALGTEKPRLYVSVEYGKAKIIKAKNWKAGENPNGMVRKFKLAGGWKFIPEAEWGRE